MPEEEIFTLLLRWQQSINLWTKCDIRVIDKLAYPLNIHVQDISLYLSHFLCLRIAAEKAREKLKQGKGLFNGKHVYKIGFWLVKRNPNVDMQQKDSADRRKKYALR